MRKVIRWVAVILAALGVGGWVYQGLTSDELLPWVNGWMAAPIVATTVLPFVFVMTSGTLSGLGGGDFRGGALGIGTLVEARRTGLAVNGQPQLDIVFDVDTAEGQRFRATARQVIDLTELAMITPGRILAVRYRPDRLDGRIAIAADADPAEARALLQRVRLAQGKTTPEQIRIAERGIEARAVVIEMRPTGEVRADEAVVELLLRVTRPDGSTFDARVQKALPPSALSGVQPGTILRAKYLPEDEQQVGIEVRIG